MSRSFYSRAIHQFEGIERHKIFEELPLGPWASTHEEFEGALGVGIYLALLGIGEVLIDQNEILEEISRMLTPKPPRAVSLGLHVAGTPRKENLPMTQIQPVVVDLTHDVLLSCSPTDANGAPVTGETLVWETNNPAVLTLQPSADGQSCRCVTTTQGSATVTVTNGATGDMVAISVEPVAKAVSLGLSAQVVAKITQ